MSCPLNAPLQHHCPLVESLGFTTCSNRSDDFFLDSHDSSLWNHISQSHVSCFRRSFEVGRLPIELSPMFGSRGLLSPVA